MNEKTHFVFFPARLQTEGTGLGTHGGNVELKHLSLLLTLEITEDMGQQQPDIQKEGQRTLKRAAFRQNL